MSKRMVDLQVENGKVASINGNEVGGTAVEANPQEAATQQLEKIKIDNIAYNIAGGEGVVKLYRHSISFLKTDIVIYFDVYSTIPNAFTFAEFKSSINKKATCTGLVKIGNIQVQPVSIYYKSSTKEYYISYINSNGESSVTYTSDGSVSLLDEVSPV